MDTLFSTDLWQTLQTLAGPVGAAAWGVAVSDFFRNAKPLASVSSGVKFTLLYAAQIVPVIAAVAILETVTPEQVAAFAPYYKAVVMAVYAYVGGRTGFEFAKARAAG